MKARNEEKVQQLIRAKEKQNAIIRGLYRREPIVRSTTTCNCRTCRAGKRRLERH